MRSAAYSAPDCEALSIHAEGVLCQSGSYSSDGIRIIDSTNGNFDDQTDSWDF